MAILKLFKSRAPTMGYVFKSGTTIHFLQGCYATAKQDEIDELTTECSNGHPNFFIDPAQTEVDSEQLSPMEILRAQIREEERAKLVAAVGNPGRDMGETKFSGKLEGISNSHSIAGMQASSEAQAVAAHTPIPATPSAVTSVTKK